MHAYTVRNASFRASTLRYHALFARERGSRREGRRTSMAPIEPKPKPVEEQELTVRMYIHEDRG